MAGIDNLTPQKPGDPALPGAGRPRGSKNRSTVLKELYQMVIAQEDLSGAIASMPIEVAVMQSLVKQCLKGDIQAIKEAQDTVFGKIIDKSETSTTINTLAVIRDDKGNELKFDIGSDPDRTRKQLEDDNE